jgi:hypothetical protein
MADRFVPALPRASGGVKTVASPPRRSAVGVRSNLLTTASSRAAARVSIVFINASVAIRA